MRFDVHLAVDVDVDGWAQEYGVTVAEATTMVLKDLRERGYYYQGEKWRDLVSIASVSAQLDITKPATYKRPEGES